MIAKTRQSDYFLRLAKSRKTTYEFSDKKVEDSDLKKVLEAARWSPSCSNAQPWHFIVVRDKEKIAELIKTASKILKLREGDAIPILIGLGYEKKGAFQKPRTRKDLKKLVSGEYFGGKIRL